MIFEKYRVIVIVNIILVIFLIFSISYIIFFNLCSKFLEKRKKRKFMKWDTAFITYLDEGKVLSEPKINYLLFAEWCVRYFLTFKGDVVLKLRKLCVDNNVPEKVAEFLKSKKKEKRIFALAFFSAGDFSFPEKFKDILVSKIDDSSMC